MGATIEAVAIYRLLSAINAVFEHANIRAALGWLLERQQAETALVMATGVRRFWEFRYHYAEGHAATEPVVSQGRIGVAVFAHDFQTIRPLAERDNAQIVHWSEFDRGGHYAVLEVPDLVVGDLRTFFA